MSLVVLVGCQAGPSAFDRPDEAAGVPDTAELSELGEIPRAPEVEPLEDPPAASAVTGDRGGAVDPGQPAADGAITDPAAAGGAAAAGGEGVETAPATDGPADRQADGEGAPGEGPPFGPADEVTYQGAYITPDGEPLATPHGTFPRPEHVRGLYLNAWASGSTRRVDALLDVARGTEINTFVIDIKDASGYVSHRTQVPLAREIGATEEIRIRDLPGLLARLEAEGIYPIARIVIVKDPLLSAARPGLAVQDTAGGVWVDSKEIVWLNPFDTAVWDYHLALAKEVAEMGFPEIQWDYVRFPDAPRSDLDRAVFPGADGRTKAEAIRSFLAYSREELAEMGVAVTADVFGVTTSATRDVGIGQVWEEFIDVVDVALPMVYPSHYWKGSFGIEEPNAYPYEVVREALEDAVRRSQAVEGAGATRPWLQDFSLGEPAYGAPEVRAQIQATYDVGIREWILWNPGSRYTVEALEPVGGWPAEPEIRVADQVVPVSRRWDVLNPEEPVLVAPEGETEKEVPEAVADSAAPAVAADSTAPLHVEAPTAPAADSTGSGVGSRR